MKGGLGDPGILRCRVNWRCGDQRHSMLSAAAFDPYEIRPTATEPDDFDEFWRAQKTSLAEIDPAPELRHDPDLRETGDYDFRKLSLDNIEETRVHGYLATPKGRGKGPFPAILTLQNHGGGAWSVPREWATGFAEKGFIALAINTHDVDNGLDKVHYDRLNRGPLASYSLRGFMDRDRYYFKTVYTRVVRAIDYLTGLPEWDRRSMILTGRSQGGGLSLVGASLDDRVTGVVCAVPALCEHGGTVRDQPRGYRGFSKQSH